MSARHDSGCRNVLPMLPGVIGAATFRGERDEHRLTLSRDWGGDLGLIVPFVLWIGMNPSGAEADRDDLTIRKEQEWTRRLGFAHYVKANVGTYRHTDSRSIPVTGAALVHPDNFPVIRDLAAAAAIIVLSVGNPPEALEAPARELFRLLGEDRQGLLCLGTTRAGWPRHSSRIAYATPFEIFHPERIAA